MKNKKASGEILRIVFALVLFSLMGALLITVAVNLGNNYGRTSSEIGGGSLDETNFLTSIQNVSSSAEDYRTNFESGKIDNVDDPSGIWDTLKNFINLITTPFTLLGQVAENILGVPSWVMDIILGLISLSLIVAIYFAIRSGT
jgi:hypothetical protein